MPGSSSDREICGIVFSASRSTRDTFSRGRGVKISLAGKPGPMRPIAIRIGRSPRCQTIYVAVVHAECSRDQNRIVNLYVRRALLLGPLDILRLHLLAAALYLSLI